MRNATEQSARRDHNEAMMKIDEAAPVSGQTSVAAPPAPAVDLKFADPTSLGLFGLAIGCASLLPLAFGMKAALTVDALRTTAVLCLLFGGGCQFLAGLMSFANKNMLGGTLLTTFSFNWVMNWWAIDGVANGKPASGTVVLFIDVCFLAIFFAMTYAFAFYSRLLVVFLLDIDMIYALRIARELTHAPALGLPVAIATVVLMLLSIYIAVALVLVNASGKTILPLGAPLLTPAAGVVAGH